METLVREINSILEKLRKKKVYQKDISLYISKSAGEKGFSEAYITLLKNGAKPTGSKKRKEFLEYLRKIQEEVANNKFWEQLKSGSKELEIPGKEKIDQYLNKQFYLYFFDDHQTDEPSIGRAVLKIGSDYETVYLQNVDEFETDYTGSFKLHTNNRYLIFDLHTASTREKGLHIKVYRAPERVPPYTIGTYSNIEASGSLAIGTLILENKPAEEKLTPARIHPDSDLFKQINPQFIQFLRQKSQNYIKLPSNGLFREEDFRSFFQKNPFKNKNVQIGGKGIFLSIPKMGAEEYQTYRKLALDLKETFEKVYNYPLHSAYAKFNSPDDWTPKGGGIAFSEIESLINASDNFILIYPEKKATFSFVELGMALALNKHILVFSKKFDDLPEIFIDMFSLARVRFSPYNSVETIHEIIKSEGHKLLKLKIAPAKPDPDFEAPQSAQTDKK